MNTKSYDSWAPPELRTCLDFARQVLSVWFKGYALGRGTGQAERKGWEKGWEGKNKGGEGRGNKGMRESTPHISFYRPKSAPHTCLWTIICLNNYQLTLYGHIKTVEQRTIIHQYDGWYNGRWWVGCYIWYSEEGPERAAATPNPLIAVPNVTAHPLMVSVPTSYYLMWHYNCLCNLKG